MAGEQHDKRSEAARRSDAGRGATRPRKLARGFATMDNDRQRGIASEGGRAAHRRGTAHEFTSEEAREAGRKGGMATSRNREHMAQIGRKGGAARSGPRTATHPGKRSKEP